MTVRRPTTSLARVVAVVAVAVSLSLGCGSPSSVGAGPSSVAPTTEERVDPGSSAEVSTKKVFKQDQPDIAVLVGEKFAIRLPEDPAAGQEWKVLSAPDGRLVKPDGDSFKAEVPAPGSPSGASAGQHEFKFKAKAPGTTTITLNRCTNCPAGSNGSKDMTEPVRATFTITVS
jgi:predicted secreted protein